MSGTPFAPDAEMKNAYEYFLRPFMPVVLPAPKDMYREISSPENRPGASFYKLSTVIYWNPQAEHGVLFLSGRTVVRPEPR